MWFTDEFDFDTYEGHRFCEEGKETLDDPDIWFFTINGNDSPPTMSADEVLDQYDPATCADDPSYGRPRQLHHVRARGGHQGLPPQDGGVHGDQGPAAGGQRQARDTPRVAHGPGTAAVPARTRRRRREVVRHARRHGAGRGRVLRLDRRCRREPRLPRVRAQRPDRFGRLERRRERLPGNRRHGRLVPDHVQREVDGAR